MSSKPSFTVVVPSFNQGQFIGQTIHSILNQKDVDVRVLVFDAKSKDETLKILRSYGDAIEWKSEKDRGQSDAINKGINVTLQARKVENHFFAYLNSDDFYYPGALKKVADEFTRHPSKSWLVGECEIVNEQGQQIQSFIKVYKAFWRKILTWPILLILNPIPQPAVFIRVSAVKEVGLLTEELQYVMDYEYWLRFWKQLGKPLVINQVLAAFRIHQTSKGSTGYSLQFAEQLLVAKKFTQNQTILFLQKMHNRLIIALYKLLK